MNIKVGDIVRVVDWGCSYSTYTNWFLERADKLKPEWIARYAYHKSDYEKYPQRNSDNRWWKVLFVDNERALITRSPAIGEVYLIRIDGLAPATRRMTLSEIEDILGYPIEIVG